MAWPQRQNGPILLSPPGDIAPLVTDITTSLNQTAGTIPVNVLTGGASVALITTNATPGTQTTRTAAQLYADDPTAFIGGGYTLIIANSGAGTLTLAGGTGVTVTGTATVATNTARIFNVRYGGTEASPTVTITNLGTYTYT